MRTARRWAMFAAVALGGLAGLLTGPSPASAGASSVCPAAVDTAPQGWVCMLYNLELGRGPGAADLAYWTGVAATQNNAAATHGIVFSPESTSRYVALTYQAQLGRDADPAGLAYWSGIIATTGSERPFEQGVFTSGEFVGTFATSQAWVGFLYDYYLGRPADAAGVNYWTGELLAGRLSAGQIVSGFQGSPEAGRVVAEIAFRDALHRAGDPAGLAFWTSRAQQVGLLRVVAEMASHGEAVATLGAEGQSPNPAFPDPLFAIIDAVVAAGPAAPGSACPAPDHDAVAASTGHTMVICGVVHSHRPVRPTAAGLGGSFVADHGAFSSGRIRGGGGVVVLGSVAAVEVSESVGTGRTVDVQVVAPAPGRVRGPGSATLGGYEVLSRPPIAADDGAPTDEDSSVVITVLDNDTEPDGDTMTVTGIGGTPAGDVSITGGGTTVTYDPDGQFESLAVGESDTDTFTYTVEDPAGGSDTATVTVTITGVNDAPNAVNDGGIVFTVGENGPTFTTGSVLANDTDPDTTDVLVVQSFDTTGTVGLVSDNGDGTFDYDPDGQFEGLAVGATDTDTFTYTVTDGEGGTDTATVTITIAGANDAPTAVDDSGTGFAADEDGPAITTGNVLANDTDPDATDVLSVSALDTTGTLGSVTDNEDGTFEYDPNGAFESLDDGESGSDSFTYTVSDGNGGTDTATVTISIAGANDAPDAVDDAASTNEDSSVVVAVLANDVDPDDALTVTVVTNPDTGGTASITNGGADVTFDPGTDFKDLDTGDTRQTTFTYTASDGDATDTATVTVTVTGVEDAPDAVDDVATTTEDASTVVDVLANDVDPDDTLTVTVVSAPDNGGTVTISNDGADVTFDPGADFQDLSSGSEQTTFTYTVSDGTSTDTASVVVTITGLNDAPVVNDATFSVDENLSPPAVVGTPTSGDPDSGQTLAWEITAGNDDGDFTIDPGTGAISTADALDHEATPSYSLTVKVTDNGSPVLTDTATVTVNVTNVNEAPSVTAPASLDAEHDVPELLTGFSVDEPDAEDITLTLTAGDGTFTVGDVTGGADVAGEGTDTLTLTGTDTEINTTLGDPDGVTYLNDVGFAGATDTIGSHVQDAGGLFDDASTTVQFNQPPLAADTSASTAEDTASAAIELTATDPDDDDLTFSISIDPLNGTLSAITNVDCATTLNTCTADVTYTPSSNFNGSDSFAFQVSDGLETDTGNVSVTVTEVNDAPVAADDGLSAVAEDSGQRTIAFTALTGNDSAGPANESGQTLTVTGVANPVGGTVSISGTDVLFTPAANFNGTASFEYTVQDNGTTNGVDDFKTDTGTATFSITAVNDGPTNTVPGAQTVDEDTDLVFAGNLSVTDIDAGASPIKVSLDVTNGTLTLSGTSGLTFVDATANGTASVHVTGTQTAINTALNGLAYKGTLSFNGSDTLNVVTDDQGNSGTGGALSDTDAVAITVTPA